MFEQYSSSFDRAAHLASRSFFTFPYSDKFYDFFWMKVFPVKYACEIPKNPLEIFTPEETEKLWEGQTQLLQTFDEKIHSLPSVPDINHELKKIIPDFFGIDEAGLKRNWDIAAGMTAIINDVSKWLYRHPDRDDMDLTRDWLLSKIGNYGQEAAEQAFTYSMQDIGYFISKKLEENDNIDLMASQCSTRFQNLCLTSEQRRTLNEIFKDRKSGRITAEPISPHRLKHVFDGNIVYLMETGTSGSMSSAFTGNPYPSSIRAGRTNHGFRAETFDKK